MAAKRRTRNTPAAAYTPMNEATVATVRTMLNDAVQAQIALLEAASDEGFAAAWEEAMRPTAAFWQLYLLLPLIAFPGEPAPDQRHEPALLLAPALLAPTLATLAFAPGGLQFGLTTWQGWHPAATRIIGYRVTDDASGGWLGLRVQPDGGTGGRTSLHRRTVQTLHLLFPFRAAELLRLPLDERFATVQRVAATLNTESMLFSEVLPVGGTVEQMGQAMKELLQAIGALACMPWGVTMFGYRWEIGTESELAIQGDEIEPVAAEEATRCAART